MTTMQLPTRTAPVTDPWPPDPAPAPAPAPGLRSSFLRAIAAGAAAAAMPFGAPVYPHTVARLLRPPAGTGRREPRR
jgi:hypothetical protein